MQRFMIKAKEVPIVLALLLLSNKWLFESVFKASILELILLVIILGVGIFNLKGKMVLESRVVFLFAVMIFVSVISSSLDIREWGRAALFILIIALAGIIRFKQLDYHKFTSLLLKIAAFHSVFVLLHMALGSRFSNMYISFLGSGGQGLKYFDKGYYFGLHTTPHELAGIFSFGIAVILVKKYFDGKLSKKNIFALGVFTICLLLTGKKGVALATLGAYIIMVNLKNFKYVRWNKFLLNLFIFLLFFCGFLYWAWIYGDSALFYRIHRFLVRIMDGASIDSGRFVLYSAAYNLWQDNFFMGIGWYHFIHMSNTVLGFNLPHQVNCDYLQWLCEMGIIGFVVNMIVVLTMLYRSFKLGIHYLPLVKDESTAHFLLYAIYVQILICLYALVEIPFYDMFYMFFYVISAIVINYIYVHRKKLLVNN